MNTGMLGRANLLRVVLVTAAATLSACLLALVALHKQAEATFPGKNGRIAFLSGHPLAIHTVNPDGSALRQITQYPPLLDTFSLPPPGRRTAPGSHMLLLTIPVPIHLTSTSTRSVPVGGHPPE
jgi:hypothetical protein